MKAGRKNLHDSIQRTHHWQKRSLRWWKHRALEFVILGGGIAMLFVLFEILEIWVTQ
tara:strand:- start:267 stop:437 length:171 start_codon:yes stop_codon:yes gene_type:complete